ncbi:elongation factor 1-alpha C-terminal domain-related protein [Pontibacter sp. H249]|uniref:elongation factor 1-alpha C-terminal domain-related protein n=1 Tax=Pontibacter sp. H249 TaxID=3133420 RepID=UPI0030BE8168
MKQESLPNLSQELEVLLCWMDKKPLLSGNKYLLQLNSTTVKAMVTQLQYCINVETLQKEPEPGQALRNDIVKASIKTATPLPHVAYQKLRENGGAILIDETSRATVAACMIG